MAKRDLMCAAVVRPAARERRDFSDRRLDIWKETLDPGKYELRE